MKLHHILKDFHGSQTGHDFQVFKADTTAPLSDSLAVIAVGEGWAKPAEPDTLVGGPHPKLAVEPDAPIVLVEHRETKVTGPDETKPDLAALSQKELLALAKERGIPVKFGTKKEAVLALLAAA